VIGINIIRIFYRRISILFVK